MKILVAIKQRVDGTVNPFDEIALEAALRMEEREIIVISVGPVDWENSLRTALAMGADQAIRVEAPENLEPLWVAHCLAVVARREGVDLILCGRQAVDEDHHQTGQMTAALLGWGQATCAVELGFRPHETGSRGEAIVLREVDGGLERWAVPLPAVITADLRLNAIHATGGPRYASLPNIMRARRKPLTQLSPEMLGISLTANVRCLALHPSPQRPPGKRVYSVRELVATLDAANLL